VDEGETCAMAAFTKIVQLRLRMARGRGSPGGPISRTPLGGRAPRRVNLSGERRYSWGGRGE
jgi:hypothetical protein